MLKTIYYRYIRKLLTTKDERDQFSGGLWPRLVREKAEQVCRDPSGKLADSGPMRIADLGCGEGLFLQKLAEQNPGAEIVGVDLDEAHLDGARMRISQFPHARVVCANMFTSGLPESSFDCCFCLNTTINLNRIPDDLVPLFAEVRRILKPGGTFVFDIRNAFNPLIRLQYAFVKLYDPYIKVPVHAVSPRTTERLLNNAGFKVLGKEYIGYPKNLCPPAILFITTAASEAGTS